MKRHKFCDSGRSHLKRIILWNFFQNQLPRCMICFATQEIRLRDGRPALRGPAPRKTGCPAPLRKTPLLPRPDPPRRSGQNWLNKKKMKQILQYKIISVIFEVVCFFRFGVEFLIMLCFSICIFRSRDPLQEYLHCLQVKGFLPVCESMWYFILLLWLQE